MKTRSMQPSLPGLAAATATTWTQSIATVPAVANDQVSFRIRTGVRFGGREPVMMPELAMELSAWYIGEVRTDPNAYGFDKDREVNRVAHQFWARGLLTYTRATTWSGMLRLKAATAAPQAVSR